MQTLSEVTEKYLESNGIMIKYFASYIGCSSSKCSQWFKGERRLSNEEIVRVHKFLNGEHVKTVQDVIKE